MIDGVLRRNFVKGAVSVVALGALAGCSEGGNGGDGNGSGDGNTTTTDGNGGTTQTTDGGDTTTTDGGNTTTTDGGDTTTTDGGNTTTTAGGNGTSDGQQAIESYMADANNYDSIRDATGQSEVSVDVGAGNGFAFGPAAVRVSPGTTVTWSWTGEGGSHNVVATGETGSDFEFRSGDPKSSGSFSQTFDEAGVALYYCEPHRAGGMKGAVLVE